MRRYENTHPWIKFSCDLGRADPKLWILLGEAASKCDHLAGVPLRPYTAKRMYQVYLAKGIAATTSIEGNTLSEEQVLEAIEGKLKVSKSMEYQKQEVGNIMDAFNTILFGIKTNTLGQVSSSLICGYNGAVLKNLELEKGIAPGTLRTHQAVVGRVYRGIHAEDCQYLLDRLCGWLNGPDFQTPSAWPVCGDKVFAILKAIIAHVYLAWIHPFGDGNGRTARLLELHILLAAGIPAPAAHLLSNHYNLTRPEYYRQLALASKSGGDLLPFINYAVLGFVEGLHKQLVEIWEQQWDVVWENYINEFFGEVKSKFRGRQRKLALAIAKADGWLEISDIPTASIALAREYSGKTQKMIKRDVEYLREQEIIEVKSNKIRANGRLVFRFLP
jgi:Fic family protein